MSVVRNDNLTTSVSHTEKREENRRKRWFYFNTKSCMAMALSAALLFTSVDGMTVRAEELGDMVPPAAEEVNPENPENQENQETFDESLYLKNGEGAVIITSFKDLQEKDSRIELLGRKTLEEVRKLMPATLTANVMPASSTGEDSGKPDEGENNPDEGEKPGEGETNPGEGEEQPGEGDKGDQGGSDSDSGDNGDNGGAGSNDGDSGSSSDKGEENSSGDSGEADSQSAGEEANDTASAVKSGTFAQDGQRWRLLVETGESGAESAGDDNGSADNGAGDDNGDAGSEGDNAGGEGSGNEGDNAGGEESGSEGGNTGGEGSGSEGDNAGGGDNGSGNEGDNAGGEDSGSEGDNAGGGDNGSGSEGDIIGGGDSGNEDGAGSGTEGGDSDENAAPETVEVEVPVTWECENYDTEKLNVYTFVPKWDEKEWFFEESEEHKIPVIEVVYTVPASEVSTEEELAAAFAAGYEKIVLKNDIALTKPLTLPADANIELDGDGYKLTRGKIAADGEESRNSETFLGIMINMNGEDYTEDTYGTLTLRDITVDGGTEADRAGAPAILDWGNLIMDEGAVIRDNYNYGTYPRDEDGETILDYGGGIQVHRELTLSADSLVTENFADEFGGGVYLAGGATLYLYADVIVNNSVGEGHGYGADLYAAPGSTIYYDPSIDMEREGFYICEGVTLIPMGIMETALEDLIPVDAERELYIYVDGESGYTPGQIAKLKEELRGYGYTILEGRTDIDTSDLTEWYVYDHYDENIWGSYAKWAADDRYKSNPKRGYYPYKSVKKETDTSTLYEKGYYYFPTNPVTTIKDWLTNTAYGSGTSRRLAQFEEHIYSREDEETGSTMMTFVGYGDNPYVDFMLYEPDSDGEKVVDYDVDSTVINTHTLLGNGFLVNTGIDTSGNISGYLLLYTYAYNSEKRKYTANQLILYRINGSADTLHEGPLGSVATKVTSETVSGDWEDQMSVQIRVTPDRIVVRQQPQSQGTDISKAEKVLEYDIPEGDVSGHNGFGPLVAYTSHACYQASSFTYSDLRMYYTNPQMETGNILSALEKADFTQADTQKYFINLFGVSDNYFANSVESAKYLGYVKMMQTEGIALVTDRKTRLDSYLGEANDLYDMDPYDPGSNLFELGEGGELPEPKKLAELIHNSIQYKDTTELKEKVAQEELTKAEPYQSVGNIWLQSAETGEQIRELYESDFTGDTYQIRVIDDIAYYDGETVTVTYKILKPNATDPTDPANYVTLGTGTAGSGYTITISNINRADWPAGDYTVVQEVSNSNIKGYAYLRLSWKTAPIPTYTVTVTVRKDGKVWADHGKDFMLLPESGGDLIKPSGQMVAGKYFVFEQTEDGSLVDTGASVELENDNGFVIVNYYTVTFYDENSDDKQPYEGGEVPNPQIVLQNQCAARLDIVPTKEKYTFVGWVTADGTEFDFDSEIDKTIELYAKWERIAGPRYKVTINVRKDGEDWQDSGRIFALQLVEAAEEEDEEEVGEIVYDLEQVKQGTYRVYDITGSARSRAADTAADVKVEDGDTGVTVTVRNENETAAVDYYTVTFYDGKKAYGTEVSQSPMVVLNGKKASEPPAPGKKGYRFTGWKTGAGGSTAFDFDQAITSKTDIYAGWKAVRSESGKEDEEDIPDGGGSEDMQTIAVRQEASPQAGTSQPESESEPKTEDATQIEIYATVAMIAGLTYLLLYFMEEGRGMTEREKEVFVAAFIRWAKKGGRFRKCCAIVAIFCILVYYHSIGKRSGEKISREYLKHAL